MSRREFMMQAQKEHYAWCKRVDGASIEAFNASARERRGYGKRKK